jgi:superfamily II DNA or RNA helicase
MAHIYVYPDIWQEIARFLESDDLFAVSATCKSAYKAFKRECIQSKISFPMVKPKRLTYDQRDVIRRMEGNPIPVKLVSSAVGSGKSIVSLAYGLRKNFDKIFLAVPPSLIKMWWETCKEFFGIDPLVLHTCNPKYHMRTDTTGTIIPEQKIILTSYKIMDRSQFAWLAETNCLIIIDEAHHHLSLYGKSFKEIIALSATAFTRRGLAYGITTLIGNNDVELKDISFNLEQTVIASKLEPVVHLPPHKWKIPDSLADYIIRRKSPGAADLENNLRDLGWIAETLSHPFIVNMHEMYFGGTLCIGRKKIRIPMGNEMLFYEHEVKFRETNGEIFMSDVNTYYKMLEKEKQVFAKKYLKEAMRKCVKYYQCLSIIEYVKSRGEKVVIFDNNVTYLPFLHKFLIDKGINSYLFSTHYDVTSRQNQIEKFKKDPEANVLLSSTAMLGEGHNITEANHIIFLSAMGDPNKYVQAIGRIARYPQKKKMYIHYLFNSEMDQKIHQYSKGECNLAYTNWETAIRN